MSKPNTLYRSEFNHLFGMLTVFAWIKGIKFICYAYTRTAEEQNRLYQKGLSNCDGYKTISMHQRDRARDLAIITDAGQPVWDFVSEYYVLGEYWESLGGIWGGRWNDPKDPYHFQY